MRVLTGVPLLILVFLAAPAAATPAPDLAAIGEHRTVLVGAEVAIRVGMLNRGPGVLRPGHHAVVRLPTNVSVRSAPVDCSSDWSRNGFEYRCAVRHTLAAGERAIFEFRLRVELSQGRAGEVLVDGRMAGITLSQSAPEIVPLPDPGPVGPISAGGVLLAMGVLLTLTNRSRAR
ncbi:hypothetical protein Ate02nite_75360 [Paractinoplanes tereljensis]|uniref:DUF11 domain-containing protein n=2 Tax=Paractinoplanes tereljensis TaxID=571912 RepID=A0A919NVM8_9ACTN|nr:hypothetical protein Ate02nite_75360 [Actinoplanes tereljensis]